MTVLGTVIAFFFLLETPVYSTVVLLTLLLVTLYLPAVSFSVKDLMETVVTLYFTPL